MSKHGAVAHAARQGRQHLLTKQMASCSTKHRLPRTQRSYASLAGTQAPPLATPVQPDAYVTLPSSSLRALRATTSLDQNARAIAKETAAPEDETIFALSTAPGRAGVAIIRISGPRATEALKQMTNEASAAAPKQEAAVQGKKATKSKKGTVKAKSIEPRKATIRRIVHPVTKELLDRAVVLYFQAPASFTGEDVVELHVHGGKAVVRDILGALDALPSFRIAERGEFAQRAFHNQKLDLTEIEGLADLINAETEVQRRLALQQAGGGLKLMYETWRSDLLRSLAYMEALIDFGEDEQLDTAILDTVKGRVQTLQKAIQQHLNDGRRGEIMRDGVHIAIVGPPNAGKSSFMNIMAQREASIVSQVPGTTRDIVEVAMNVQGYPVVLADTAGIRPARSLVEREGIRRAIEKMMACDMKLCFLDITELQKTNYMPPASILEQLDEDTLVVFNKTDLWHTFKPIPAGKMRMTNAPLAPLQASTRRAQKGRVPITRTMRGKTMAFGQYGLRILRGSRLTQRQLEAIRFTVRRKIRQYKGSRLWMRVFPNIPVSSKPAEVRMGKGKGRFDHYMARVPQDRIILEIGGAARKEAVVDALKLAAAKLPVPSKMVTAPERGENVRECREQIERALKQANKRVLGYASVSLKNNNGLLELIDRIARLLKERYDTTSDASTALITQSRHRAQLQATDAALAKFLTMAAGGANAEIVLAAEELRSATQALGKITGRVDVEEILGEIFQQFCIGK